MIRICAGMVRSAGHYWVEVYIWLPGDRTWMGSWTRGLGWDAGILNRSYRTVTGTL